VRWSKSFCGNEFDKETKLYSKNNRLHVIGFDEIDEESDPIKHPSDSFEVKMERSGTLNFKCSIYTRLRGVIEVVDT
jgi:hypothetical protein